MEVVEKSHPERTDNVEACCKIPLEVSDADNIMLDLEESTCDSNTLQDSLSAGFDSELSQEDLDSDLELMLSDDTFCPAAYNRPARTAKSAPAEEQAALAAEPPSPAQPPSPVQEPPSATQEQTQTATENQQTDTAQAEDAEAEADKDEIEVY
jgi:hypothetical protein